MNLSSAPGRDLGTVYILALDANGKTRVDDHFAETSNGPYIGGVFPFESSNKLVVRVGQLEPHPSHEELWFYEFDGSTHSVCEPFALVRDECGYPTAYTRTSSLIAVHGEPLVLVHGLQSFSDQPGEWGGARDRWKLFDLNGDVVWSLDDAKDPSITDLGKSVAAFKARKNSIASLNVGEFETLALRTKERVTYSTAMDQTAKTWKVTEKSREALKP